MNRFIVLIVVLLISIGVDFSYGVSPALVHILSSVVSDSIVQKPTDNPKDKAIKIVIHDGGKFCYAPVFSGGESYIQLEQCWEQDVTSARYDVFQRISYYINKTWLCITAPEGVILGERNWDYVHLRPCTINDPLQRWIVKENSFWTADERYRLKDVKWYAYISKKSKDSYNHTLDSSMKDWVQTVATPGNISIKTSIAWNLGNSRYFIHSKGSKKSTTSIYYNPESGHVAQYNPVSGRLSCMYSKVGSYQWNWIRWVLCDDIPTSKDSPAYWDVYLETEEGGMLKDYKGNILRVTRYGSNWGVVYAAKPSFLEKDTTNSPTSLFLVDGYLLDWIRYAAGNLGNTEQYCPAGNKESHVYKRIKRTLPPDFQLTDDWIRRLYQIATSATLASAIQIHGMCGVCLLQSFQMLAELQEYYSQGPLQSGGYFFDTAHDRDPFVSFGQRYPLLDMLLTDVPRVYGLDGNTTRLLGLASARTMLPQYDWIVSDEFLTRPEIMSHIDSLINSPPGSIWLGMLGRERSDGIVVGHAVPILRTSQGLVVIQTTSLSTPFDLYRQALMPTMDPLQVIYNLEAPDRALTVLITIQLGDLDHNAFNFIISNRNCTGEGDDRRGTGEYPTSASVNQCPGSSRCALPF
ncbi:DUF1561 domain-containing protein [Leptospira mayottensis]|uniref:DUF1561 domain-containing protein n=1 Tax=Leptospira mayottensis TaxID=1137606 RepID=UPI000E35E1A9|nr:DUF1561 domain-containing protein [Leptospira mayottensis]AXR62709.1 DUF1561 domain-containing protein [Leptospira mayottensis]AZQ04092.1 DUF1561 domain-containing protein [Leptospira mayottensis 200901116]